MDVKYENGKITIEISSIISSQHEIEKCYIKQFIDNPTVKTIKDSSGGVWGIQVIAGNIRCEEKDK